MGIVLPKKDENGVYYLSYSQISTWKKSKRDYMRQYFFGETFEGNAYTEFGSLVGGCLEKGDFSPFEDHEAELLKKVPRYDEFEREIKLQMKGYYVKGYIDTNTKDFKKIADYKTGDVDKKAGEYEDDSYNQLEIYSAGLQQETGVLPEEAKVFLIDRTGNAFKGEELKLGSSFISIEKTIDEDRIKEVLKDIDKIAVEISNSYKVFLKLNK